MWRIRRSRRRRDRVRASDPALFDEISSILFAEDPVGINFEDNTDEYDAEAGTIIPRLASCESLDECQTIVHQEFVDWFTAEVAGDRERYLPVAQRIWSAWLRHQEPAA